MTNKQIFLLNGPPSSGKDSIGKYITDINKTFTVDKLAYPLKQACKVMFSLSDEEFLEYDTNVKLKVTPQERFYGVSWRQVNIDLSEKYIKHQYDSAFFGKSLASRIKNSSKERFLITDSGFMEEVAPLVATFGVDNVFLIQLHRDGYTFVGDSRSYLDGDKLGIKRYILTNDNLDKFLNDATNLIYSLTYPKKSDILVPMMDCR